MSTDEESLYYSASIVGSARIIEPPKPVGCYVIGGDWHMYVSKRPRWLARKLCALLLGWQWKDGWP